MKHIVLIFCSLLLFLASCEKEEIVIIEEEETIIANIDMEEYFVRYLEGYKLKWINTYSDTIRNYYFELIIDSTYFINIRPMLCLNQKEAMQYLSNTVSSISLAMSPRTEDLQPLGDEYWRSPVMPPIQALYFRRHNFVFKISSQPYYETDVTPFARAMDNDILNKADYIIFKE
jgi:hypothetical protein